MKAVITGDIINSRKLSSLWMKDLKDVLSFYGNEPKIYRGESFQLVADLADALVIVLLLKATIKQHKALDVRIAIGIGTIDYTSNKVTESNGSAFINSGGMFTRIKNKLWEYKRLGLDLTRDFYNYFQLVVLFADKWTTTSA
jgi:hypothetical protein